MPTSTFPQRSLVAAALVLCAASLAPVVRAQDAEAPKKQTKADAERARRAEKAEREEAKREKKLQKEQDATKNTRESKRREMIESGAKTAIEWYDQALQHYKAGRYLDARSILLPLEDSARAVEIQEKVKLLIAETYFEQGGALNLAEALARYKSYLTFFPGSENAAYAQYQLGRSYFKQLGHPDRDQSYTDQAIFEYQKLIENYPDSEWVDEAQRDVLEAKARRAQHEFEVAQFYWDWNDKAAAAARLKQVLKERPELPQREKALYMAAQALYDTGQREEGDAYAARLQADYPESSYVSRLQPRSEAVAKQASRKRKEEKETARTARALSKQERRRTRIVRRDSGLPADVPQTWDLAGSTTPAAATPAAAPAPSSAEMEKQRQREERQRAEAAKLEAEEQERNAKEAEREQKKQAARDKELAERAAKEAKKAEDIAAETPQQKAEREKKEAKAKAEADRLEAEEARRAEKLAEADAKRAAEQAAEDAKKAKKRAKKK